METTIKAKTIQYGMMGTTVFTEKEDYFIPILKTELKAKVRKYHKRNLLKIKFHTLNRTNFKVIDEVEKVKGGSR